MTNFSEVSTSQLFHMITQPDVIVVDLRDVDAYNGWMLRGEQRSGHIKGARSLPAKWTKYMDWIEVVQSKDISPHNRIVLYSYDADDCIKVAQFFEKAAYKNLYIYCHYLSEWNSRSDLPMENMARYKQLVPSWWVKNIVDHKLPSELEGKNTVIVHSHYRNREAYLSGHIPGAIDMDTLALESPETWNRRSPAELKKALESHGITSDTVVILYGKFMWPDNDDDFPGSAAGHLGAIRNNAIMLYAGVKDVRVLNGGFQSWKDAGYEVAYDDVPKTEIADFGANIPSKPEIFVDTPEAKQMIQSNDADIVSVRSWEEYIGNVSGYNYIEKKGRIPGSVFGNCGSDAYHMENYRNLDHTVRESQEVASIWNDVGVTQEKHLAFYCGTGWRGSEAFYNAWLMGWPNVSVYDGGWFEWSNDSNNKYETGIPN